MITTVRPVTRVAGVALAVVAVHLVLLALLTGTPLAAIAALAWTGAAPFAVRRFERGGRAARVAIPAVAGLLAATPAVVTNLGRSVLNGPGATDYTGVATAVAGLVLLGWAFSGTRRLTKLLAIPLALLLLQFYVLPVLGMGAAATNAKRSAPPSPASLGLAGARELHFRAADGTRLAGWFVPGRSRAAVVVLHGSHGSRASARGQIRLLHRGGYSVLAYDARGHGESGGHANALGWHGASDLAAGVAWLRSQQRVDPLRVGVLGLSMGAEEALRAAAASGSRIRAVVADGAGASTLGDAQLEQADDSPLFTAVTWLGMRTVSLFTGEREPVPLADVARRIRGPVLLIASNRPGERRFAALLRSRIGSSARLWYVPDAAHTAALARHPGPYRARVLGFLDGALGRAS